MAKEIPYFKFFVGEWANGDITCESLEVQGLFINICSIYWTKEGDLNKRFLFKKFDNKLISELLDAEIIKIENDSVKISFLDEQLSEVEHIRAKNSRAGKASAAKRKANKKTTPVKQSLNDGLTTLQPLREEKRREEKKKEDIPTYLEFKTYAIEKAARIQKNLDENKLLLKYDSWVENNWRDGNDKEIKSWKTKLLNTLPYLISENVGKNYDDMTLGEKLQYKG